MDYIIKTNKEYRHCIIWENEEGWQTMLSKIELDETEILQNNVIEIFERDSYYRGLDFSTEKEALEYEGIEVKDIKKTSIKEAIENNLNVFILEN